MIYNNKKSNENFGLSTKPLITIVGVLGKQGRGAAISLLKSGHFRVRGITRRINAPEALSLVNMGMEIVNLPLNIGYQNEYEQAFRGSYGVFLMTPNLPPPAVFEYELGCQLAQAALKARAQYILFSSLENVAKISGGSLLAPHFTDKAKIESYIRSLPISSAFIMPAFFYTNFLEFYNPAQKNNQLEFPIYLPEDFRAPFVDPLTAIGPAVREIFTHPQQYASQSLPVIGEWLTPIEIVNTFTKVTGQKAVYRSAYSRDQLLECFPEFKDNDGLVQEITDMTQYAVQYGYYRHDRNLQWSMHLNPTPFSWQQFLEVSKWRGQKSKI